MKPMSTYMIDTCAKKELMRTGHAVWILSIIEEVGVYIYDFWGVYVKQSWNDFISMLRGK